MSYILLVKKAYGVKFSGWKKDFLQFEIEESNGVGHRYHLIANLVDRFLSGQKANL